MDDLLKQIADQVGRNTGAVKVLETNHENLRRDLDTLMSDVREIRGLVTQSAISQATAASKMSCPAPGLCVELKQQVEKLATTVQTLVENRAEARGAKSATIALGSIGGTIFGVLASIITRLIMTGKIP